MSQFQIVFTLITIVYGLVITDLFSSLHKLIRARKKVKWHWLPVATAWYVLHIILKNWWNLTSTAGSSHWNNIITFLLYAHLMILLFLLVSACLPDSVPEAGVDLKTYYLQNHKYIWGLMCGIIIMGILISSFRISLTGEQLNTSYYITNGIILLLTAWLSLNRKIIFHSIVIILFITALLAEVLLNQR